MYLRDITLDEEFETLIPPLSDDERAQLMANIEREGFRDPLVVWMNHGVLLDGHNRFRIWQDRFQSDENREPEIVQMKFATRDEAKTWIIQNQLGRRNLPDVVRVELALRLKPAMQAKAKAKQKAAGGALPQTFAEPVETRREIAKAAGVSHETVRKVESILQHGDEDTKRDMRCNKTSINAAYQKTKPSSAGTSPPRRFKALNESDVVRTSMKIRSDVERLLNRIKRTSKQALAALPRLHRDLERLADECRNLATEVVAKNDEVQ